MCFIFGVMFHISSHLTHFSSSGYGNKAVSSSSLRSKKALLTLDFFTWWFCQLSYMKLSTVLIFYCCSKCKKKTQSFVLLETAIWSKFCNRRGIISLWLHMDMLQPTAKFLAVENTILGSDGNAEVDLDRNIPVAVLSALPWVERYYWSKGSLGRSSPCFRLFVTFSS